MAKGLLAVALCVGNKERGSIDPLVMMLFIVVNRAIVMTWIDILIRRSRKCSVACTTLGLLLQREKVVKTFQFPIFYRSFDYDYT